MEILPIKPLNVAYDQLPRFALDGRQVWAKLTDTEAGGANKLNIPDSLLITAGQTLVDLNPGQTNDTLPWVNASCIPNPQVLNGAFPSGKNILNATAADCIATGKWIARNVGGSGARVIFSQMEEADQNNGGYFLLNTSPRSWLIEKAIADEQKVIAGEKAVAAGLTPGTGPYLYYVSKAVYVGQYDGCIRYDVLQRVALSNLANKESILAFLRYSPPAGQEGVNTTPFGNLAFIPHTLHDGTSVKGAAEYRDVLYSTYYQGGTSPAEAIAFSGFAAMLCEQGLLAIADEISDTTRKAAVQSRSVWNFAWNSYVEQSTNAHVVQRFRPPGLTGFSQWKAFQPNSPALMRASGIVGLLASPKSRRYFDFEDTSRSGTNPAILRGFKPDGDQSVANNMGECTAKAGFINGEVAGYVGVEQPQLGIAVYKYTPTLPTGVKLGYPYTAIGNMDIIYSILDAVSRVRTWVGESTPVTYLSVKSGGESSFCSVSAPLTYIYTRWKINGKGWGYLLLNLVTNKASIVYTNFHLRPDESEVVSCEVQPGVVIALGTLAGGDCHEFVVDLSGASA